jgi:rhodanese-related sulfurtransferase
MFAQLMGLSTIAPRALHERMQNEEVTIIDVNSRQSWLTARVPRAVHLDPLSFQQSDLPADLDTVLVFYCSNPLCRKAPNAAKRAEKMGYRQVQVMPAGINGWLGAGLPSESGDAASTKNMEAAGA